jgi:hypothetical protein
MERKTTTQTKGSKMSNQAKITWNGKSYSLKALTRLVWEYNNLIIDAQNKRQDYSFYLDKLTSIETAIREQVNPNA